jgi:hypothetical protein
MSQSVDVEKLLLEVKTETDKIYDDLIDVIDEGATVLCAINAMAQIIGDMIKSQIEDMGDKRIIASAACQIIMIGAFDDGETIQ